MYTMWYVEWVWLEAGAGGNNSSIVIILPVLQMATEEIEIAPVASPKKCMQSYFFLPVVLLAGTLLLWVLLLL